MQSRNSEARKTRNRTDGKRSSVSGTDLPVAPAGEYDIVYRDPDGSKHSLGRVILPKL